jgi:hypothetical protein
MFIFNFSLCQNIIPWKWMNSLGGLEYADDICLPPYKYDRIQSKLNDLCRESRKAGLMINYVKTEEIRVNNTVDRPRTIENREIKCVTNFCHFGSNGGQRGPRNSWMRLLLLLSSSGHDADQSPVANSKVKKRWIYTSSPPYAFMAYCLNS